MMQMSQKLKGSKVAAVTGVNTRRNAEVFANGSVDSAFAPGGDCGSSRR
jgi:hypothetical protein